MAKKALGKGLSALIPISYGKREAASVTPLIEKTIVEELPVPEKDVSPEINSVDQVVHLPVSLIKPSQAQPRYVFNPDALEDLAASIKEKGVIQPVIVVARGEKYELICGERRWRAAQEIGMAEIPAIVKGFHEEEALEVALIENIQREDLNPIEEAEAFARFFERGLGHEEIAKKIGKSRSAVVNTMRLLKLPKSILQLILEQKISEGHGRAVLTLPTEDYQIRLAERIVAEGLSVRQVEEIVRKKGYQKRPAKRARVLDAQIVDLETKIQQKLGTQARVIAGKNKNKGRIEIKYFSLDDLDRILDGMGVHID